MNMSLWKALKALEGKNQKSIHVTELTDEQLESIKNAEPPPEAYKYDGELDE